MLAGEHNHYNFFNPTPRPYVLQVTSFGVSRVRHSGRGLCRSSDHFLHGGADRMGYDIHITRVEDWAENEGNEIAAEEWLASVETDGELKLDVADCDHFAFGAPVFGVGRYRGPVTSILKVGSRSCAGRN